MAAMPSGLLAERVRRDIEVVAHGGLDLDTFLTGMLGPESVCHLELGRPVTPRMVRELAERGTIQLLWHRNGVPLRLGTEERFASRAQRRALRFRHKGCAVPGCGQQRRLHAHHVLRFPDGPTDLQNLVLLCTFHHRRIHRGGWTIWRRSDGELEFRDRNGSPVLAKHPPGGSPPDPGGVVEQLGIPLDDHTAKPIGGGETLTLYGRDIYLHALLTAA